MPPVRHSIELANPSMTKVDKLRGTKGLELFGSSPRNALPNFINHHISKEQAAEMLGSGSASVFMHDALTKNTDYKMPENTTMLPEHWMSSELCQDGSLESKTGYAPGQTVKEAVF